MHDCEIQFVAPGTPASNAGILKGDVIPTLDGTPIINPPRFLQTLADSIENPAPPLFS